MAEGLLVLNLDGSIAVYNRAAEALLGLPAGTLTTGRALADVVSPGPLQALVDRLRDAAAPGMQASALEVGPRRAVRIQAAVVAGAPDGPACVLVVLDDAREAERLQSMRREFVANISHEVRTPLAAIRGYSATLLAGALGDHERARHFVEIIEQHAVRLAQLIDDLGRLADLEQGQVELLRRPVPVAAAVEMAVNHCRDRAVTAGIVLGWSIDPATPALDADRDLLDQALLRLIDNALRYTPRGGHVSVSARAERGAAEAGGQLAWVCLTVVDSGAGIPPEELPRLSERFYRPDKSRSRELGGSGLGLAVVKHIVQAHSGAMEIDSEVGRGTSVTLHWPAHVASQQPAVAG